MWRSAMIAGSPESLTVGNSSPDSAETSFRDLDDAFLQTQTRIWLGEVLNVRLKEDVGIADLLADGELLFQVSKKVWKMLLNKYDELKHSKVHIYERTSSGKSQGKYTPYPKVDSFLKICQILGLTGIDLFSPTDAVDKRDVRRVCMCIRSLSKKARVKKLEVPDFDIVTCNVLMPTKMVGSIRRNLELSQYSSSTSNVSSPEVLGLKNLFEEHSQVSDSGFDEAESFIDLEFESPLLGSSYDAAHVTDIVEETSHVSSVDGETLHETCFKNSIQDRNHYEHVDENLDELYDESIASCYSSSLETNTIPSSISIESDCAWLIQSDDQYYPGQRKCRRESFDTLISSSFNGSEFECYSSSSMCSTSIVENNEDQESNISNSNSMIDFSEAVINTSSRLKSDTEVGSEVDDVEQVDVSNHSYQIRENLLVNADRNLYGKTSGHFKFSHPNSPKESSMSEDLDVLLVSESSKIFVCSAASERILNFDFCQYDLFLRSRNSLEIEAKNFQIVDILLPRSVSNYSEGREATSDENFSVEKQVLPYTHVNFAEPNNETEAILDTTIHQKDAIITDEPGRNKAGDGRTARKSGNQVLKSVAGILTVVGALLFLLHVSGQKKAKERNNETVVPLLVQKQNQELLSKRKANMGKHNSRYPGEKLKF